MRHLSLGVQLFAQVTFRTCLKRPAKGPTRSIPTQRLFSTSISRTYDDAIDILNSLQIPHDELARRRNAGIKPYNGAKYDLMRKWLDDIGYSLEDLDRLNIIRVAGTKGKGTTCAYVDSILNSYRLSRNAPKKTGLFTSPHLIAVRERIRINTEPISPETFAKYFFEVWHALKSKNNTFSDVEKPTYFRFLTLMSYHVFLQEQVDVAIYETGVGGQFDSTNIVQRPVVTGITSLGIDHVTTLGNTLPEIAWHKAGIQKSQCPSLTVRQAPEALDVIENRAKEIRVKSLEVVDIDPRLARVNIEPDMDFQKQNASLAIRIVETALAKLDPTLQPQAHLPAEFVQGLEDMQWKGRFEIWSTPTINWFLDGAHTPESIAITASWFKKQSQRARRILVFNQPGARDAANILRHLFVASTLVHPPIWFDAVVFCTNNTRVQSKDTISHNHASGSAMAEDGPDTQLQESLVQIWREEEERAGFTENAKSYVVPFVDDVYENCDILRSQWEGEDGKSGKVDVLITGSLHLVGQVRSLSESGRWVVGSEGGAGDEV